MNDYVIYFQIPTYKGNAVHTANGLRAKKCTHHLWVFDEVEEVVWLGHRFADMQDYMQYLFALPEAAADLVYEGTKEFMQQLWVKADSNYLLKGKL